MGVIFFSEVEYAWFTMSKEVEVTGIKMTATVPENLQISLGNGMGAGAISSTTVGSSNYRLTAVQHPGNADDDVDWSNSVAIGEYYNFGKLTPATSTDGTKLFYTEDITGVGKTLTGQTLAEDSMNATVGDGGITAAFTDAITGVESTSVGVTATRGTAVAANAKYDLGGAYYIDIPVWFRASTKEAMNLAVIATYSKGNASNTTGTRSDANVNDDLYRAARVSIIKGAGTVSTTEGAASETDATNTGTTTQGVIYTTTDSNNDGAISKYYSQEEAYKAGRGTGTNTVGSIDSTTKVGTWSAVTKITEATIGTGDNAGLATAGDTVVVVNGVGSTANKEYGDACRYTIRVWIDGEDVNCWNATAGQDFNIDLRFVRKA